MENNINLNNSSDLPLKVPWGLKAVILLSYFIALGIALFWSYIIFITELREAGVLVIMVAVFGLGLGILLCLITYLISSAIYLRKAWARIILIIVGSLLSHPSIDLVVSGVLLNDNINFISGLISTPFCILVTGYFIFSKEIDNFFQTPERTGSLLRKYYPIFLIWLVIFTGISIRGYEPLRLYRETVDKERTKAQEQNMVEIMWLDNLSKELRLERVFDLAELNIPAGEQLEGLRSIISSNEHQLSPGEIRFLHRGNIKLIIMTGYGSWSFNILFAPLWGEVGDYLRDGEFDRLESRNELERHLRSLVDLEQRGLLRDK